MSFLWKNDWILDIFMKAGLLNPSTHSKNSLFIQEGIKSVLVCFISWFRFFASSLCISLADLKDMRKEDIELDAVSDFHFE